MRRCEASERKLCRPLAGDADGRARVQAIPVQAGTRGPGRVRLAVDGEGRAVLAAAATVLLLALLLALPVRGESEAGASPFAPVGKAVRPAVVSIRIVRAVNADGMGTGPLQEMYRRFFPDEQGQGGRFESPSTGSGFVVDAGGDVLTNHHVIDGADEVFVRFGGEQREYRARIVGSDPATDLSLLRIEPSGRTLPVLEFADSDKVEVGAWAIAVGNPFGNLESSLTVGVVSAKGRGDLLIGGRTPRYQDFIQTDASINHGNSGGPLVDARGRVIGVNTAISERGQGIGFAVPSNLARGVYAQLREHGRVVRGYLGVWTEDLVTVVGEERPGEPAAGVRVLKVAPGSPAAGAGVLPGDFITAYDGRPAGTNRQLQFRIAESAPGRPVTIELAREGRQVAVTVTPIDADEGEGGPAATAGGWLGVEVASLAADDERVARLKDLLGVSATAGVMVVAVEDDGPGALAGISLGDLIVSVDGRRIDDLTAWDQVRAEHAAVPAPLTILVRTGGVERYLKVEPRRAGVEN
ncbi:MAG: trypsin-like peptidase domain-containing protein [bacterium]|nr:trypsin-like peptidase domain-containing protein [bacterium]